jgi:hypothetical protein
MSGFLDVLDDLAVDFDELNDITQEADGGEDFHGMGCKNSG